MQITGVDLHARPETIAMLDTETGELVQKTLEHQAEKVREFYSALPGPVLVGSEANFEQVPWNHHLQNEAFPSALD